MTMDKAYYQMTVRKNGVSVVLTFDDVEFLSATRRTLRRDGYEVVEYSTHGYTVFTSVASAVRTARSAKNAKTARTARTAMGYGDIRIGRMSKRNTRSEREHTCSLSSLQT